MLEVGLTDLQSKHFLDDRQEVGFLSSGECLKLALCCCCFLANDIAKQWSRLSKSRNIWSTALSR